MEDELFKEHLFPSFDKKFTVRLFKLPDEDGQVRLSFEILDKGAIYQLPKEYWLGMDDQIGWCADCNVLFFTANGARKAFIRDVTFMTEVSCDLQPGESVSWDDGSMSWKCSDTRTCLKLPSESDVNDKGIKVIPTPNERYVLVISRLKKTKRSEPDLWEMGIVDTIKLKWVVEKLPYRIKGEDAVRFRNDHYMESYSIDAIGGCCLFRFDCDTIPEQGKLKVFVNDFMSKHPEKVIWDKENQCWRAVINGEVIYPRPFYYDNMYCKELNIVSTPVPISILELVPGNEKLKARINELKEQKKRQMEAEHERNNTSAAEIFSRMDKQPKRKRKSDFKVPKKPRGIRNKRVKRSFMDSPWAIILPIVILIAMIAIFFASVASGNHVGPVATKNLFSAIAILIMFLSGVIISKRSKKDEVNFVMPYIQRVLIAPLSVFVFIGIIVAYMKVFDFWRMQFHWAVVSAAPTTALLLIMYGTRWKREAKTNKQYNIGCWMQWLSIWIIMMFVLSLSITIDNWGSHSTVEQITFCPSHLMMRPGYFWIRP